MHDIKAIRENPEAFDKGLARRGLSPRAQSLIALDEKRRAAILALQTAQERRNAVSKQIGVAMARKDVVAADDYRAEVAGLKATMPELEAAEREATAALETELAAIPNLPADDSRTARTRPTMSRSAAGARRPRSKAWTSRVSISRSARRWGSWISTPRRNSRARDSWC